MQKYIFDTDILIYFLKGDQQIVKRFAKIPLDDLYTTRINYTELFYGAYNSTKKDKNLKLIKEFLKEFKIVEFDKSASEIFAKQKALLKQNGKLIQDFDLMIASIAIANNSILVTNNTKHFKRVKNLKVENWFK